MYEQLEYHKDAVVKSISLCESLEHPESSLAYKISSLNKELHDKNFCTCILKSIVKAIIFCGNLYVVIKIAPDPNEGAYSAPPHPVAAGSAKPSHTLPSSIIHNGPPPPPPPLNSCFRPCKSNLFRDNPEYCCHVSPEIKDLF